MRIRNTIPSVRNWNKLEIKITDAYKKEKRNARMKAQTRSSSHPLIEAVNEKISKLKAERKELWDLIKPARKRAISLTDEKALHSAFNERVKAAQRTENTDGLDGETANEVGRNFDEARKKVFNTPNSRLRFHRFDGTGYRFFRFKDNRTKKRADGSSYKATAYGVTLDYFTPLRENDNRPFLLTPNQPRGGVPRYKLKVKIGARTRSPDDVCAYFDIIYHRPIPDGAQINNAKLMVRRVGDHFKYTINFSVRVPVAPRKKPGNHVIGIDIGFRRMAKGAIRAAMIGSTDPEFGYQEIKLSPDYVKRLKHIEALQKEMDKSATPIGRGDQAASKGGFGASRRP